MIKDDKMLQDLMAAAREHRQQRELGLSLDRAWVSSQPAELLLHRVGARQIIAVRGDVFTEINTDVISILSLHDAYYATNGDAAAARFIEDQCEPDLVLPHSFFRRKGDNKLVFYRQITGVGKVNGRLARQHYVEMMDAVSAVGVRVVSIMGVSTFGYSEFDCYDAVYKWLCEHTDTAIVGVRLVDLHGLYHELSPSFTRHRPRHNHYDNTENFPVWKMLGRPFI